jgi:dTDP-4-amino-4,6-dideoxygalactose transaminase
MDGIQGAILRAKLKHLAEGNARRQRNAQSYRKALEGVPELVLPLEAEYAQHVYHLYVVQVRRNRAEFMKHLAAKGIGCLIHYPTPVHLQPAYRSLGLAPGSFPRTEACVERIVSLPMFPELGTDQIALVAREVKSFLGGPGCMIHERPL